MGRVAELGSLGDVENGMKWVVASIGSLIVFIGAFLAIMLLPVAVIPAVYESIVGMVAMYVVGIPLAFTAGVFSFRATLRQYARKGD
jgi:hypothetical protein